MWMVLAKTDIATQNYTFTFIINEKLDDLNITLLIDGSPILVPYWCHREFNFEFMLFKAHMYTIHRYS